MDMHRRIPVFFLTLAAVSASATAAEPKIDFWLLRAGNELADPLMEAVAGKKLTPDALDEKISSMIRSNKIKELARFTEIVSEKKIARKIHDGELEARSGQGKLDLGIQFESEVTLSRDSRMTDIRYALAITEKADRATYTEEQVNASTAIRDGEWVVLNAWNNGLESTLLLSHISPLPVEDTGKSFITPVLLVRAELLESSPGDLIQYEKSTLATRPKAADWLRSRSKRIASAFTSARSGNVVVHQDMTREIASERSTFTPSGGLQMDFRGMVGRDGKQVDLSLELKWQDPTKPADFEQPDYLFEIADTLDDGQPMLCKPSIRPARASGQLILLLTPRIEFANTSPVAKAPSWNPSKIPDKISTIIYPVAPKISRVLNPDSKIHQRMSLMEALKQRGIPFKTGMSVTLSSNCTVLLTQDRQGHLMFKKLLETLDLEP